MTKKNKKKVMKKPFEGCVKIGKNKYTGEGFFNDDEEDDRKFRHIIKKLKKRKTGDKMSPRIRGIDDRKLVRPDILERMKELARKDGKYLWKVSFDQFDKYYEKALKSITKNRRKTEEDKVSLKDILKLKKMI